MNAKEEIKKLQEQLDNLKAELDKPEFEVGDWVIATARGGNNSVHDWYDFKNAIVRYGDIDRVSDVDGSVLKVFGTAYRAGYVRKATPTEIETALIKEAEKRGFKKGVKYKGASCNWTEYIHGSLEYFKDGDVLTDGYGESVYKQGKWAEIVEDKVKFFDWDVEQIEVSTLEDDLPAYRIGCEVFYVDFLIQLKDALEYMPNKTVEEVLTELEKLDLD